MLLAPGKPWFVPKSYGCGAVPATWEGWVATALFTAAFGLDMGLERGWPRWVLAALILTAFAGIACAKTKGGCRWRWGGEPRA